jgi:hypothetical protein
MVRILPLTDSHIQSAAKVVDLPMEYSTYQAFRSELVDIVQICNKDVRRDFQSITIDNVELRFDQFVPREPAFEYVQKIIKDIDDVLLSINETGDASSLARLYLNHFLGKSFTEEVLLMRKSAEKTLRQLAAKPIASTTTWEEIQSGWINTTRPRKDQKLQIVVRDNLLITLYRLAKGLGGKPTLSSQGGSAYGNYPAMIEALKPCLDPLLTDNLSYDVLKRVVGIYNRQRRNDTRG